MIFNCLSTLFTFLWVTWLCFVFTECSLNLKHRWRAHMWRFNPGKGLTILIFPHQQGSVLMKISILNYSNFKWAPFQGKKNHDLAGWTQNRWNNSDVHYSVVFCHLYVSCWGMCAPVIYNGLCVTHSEDCIMRNTIMCGNDKELISYKIFIIPTPLADQRLYRGGWGKGGQSRWLNKPEKAGELDFHTWIYWSKISL